MGKFFAFIFGLDKEEHNDMEYYYDDINGCTDNTMVYREPDISYENNCFDGGEQEKEEDYKLYKASDIF